MAVVSKAKAIEFSRWIYVDLRNKYKFDTGNGTAQLKEGDVERNTAYGTMRFFQSVYNDEGLSSLMMSNIKFSKAAVKHEAESFAFIFAKKFPDPIKPEDTDGLVFSGRLKAFNRLVEFMEKGE